MTDAERARSFNHQTGSWLEVEGVEFLTAEFASVRAEARKQALREAISEVDDWRLVPYDEMSDNKASPQNGDGTSWNNALMRAIKQLEILRDRVTL